MQGRVGIRAIGTPSGSDVARKASATRQPWLALLATTLAFLIGTPLLEPSARAQDIGNQPADQSLQRYVPQHFDRNGLYVPPHFETPKPPPFKGYFADKQAERERSKNHGYKEPAPDYTTTPPPDDQRIEGR
jgi:hypothetical protein